MNFFLSTSYQGFKKPNQVLETKTSSFKKIVFVFGIWLMIQKFFLRNVKNYDKEIVRKQA